jgi:CCDC81-like HU domain protein/sporulation related protein
MILAKNISDLLYRYECVIVPKFGGFVSNKISAKVNHFTHTFHAPSKQLTFNSHLQNNDGLLANYIATSKNVSYAEAIAIIEKEVEDWKLSLKNDELELENIGSFHTNKDGVLIFDPTTNINYLASSFGLSSYVSPAIKRIAYKEKVTNLKTVTPIIHSERNQRKTPIFIKYAAAAAIIFALGTVGWKEYQKFEYNNLVAQSKQHQERVEKTIQEATFVISNPLPTITLNVAKQVYNYHIVAGAFRDPANAEKKLHLLIKKGYNAKILGVNKWNLTQVAYESFNSRNEAINKLNSIRKSDSKDAWLLVKEY